MYTYFVTHLYYLNRCVSALRCQFPIRQHMHNTSVACGFRTYTALLTPLLISRAIAGEVIRMAEVGLLYFARVTMQVVEDMLFTSRSIRGHAAPCQARVHALP
jgi:hypothetical protein